MRRAKREAALTYALQDLGTRGVLPEFDCAYAFSARCGEYHLADSRATLPIPRGINSHARLTWNDHTRQPRRGVTVHTVDPSLLRGVRTLENLPIAWSY
jgi:hypothetical protein